MNATDALTQAVIDGLKTTAMKQVRKTVSDAKREVKQARAQLAKVQAKLALLETQAKEANKGESALKARVRDCARMEALITKEWKKLETFRSKKLSLNQLVGRDYVGWELSKIKRRVLAKGRAAIKTNK